MATSTTASVAWLDWYHASIAVDGLLMLDQAAHKPTLDDERQSFRVQLYCAGNAFQCALHESMELFRVESQQNNIQKFTRYAARSVHQLEFILRVIQSREPVSEAYRHTVIYSQLNILDRPWGTNGKNATRSLKSYLGHVANGQPLYRSLNRLIETWTLYNQLFCRQF